MILKLSRSGAALTRAVSQPRRVAVAGALGGRAGGAAASTGLVVPQGAHKKSPAPTPQPVRGATCLHESETPLRPQSFVRMIATVGLLPGRSPGAAPACIRSSTIATSSACRMLRVLVSCWGGGEGVLIVFALGAAEGFSTAAADRAAQAHIDVWLTIMPAFVSSRVKLLAEVYLYIFLAGGHRRLELLRSSMVWGCCLRGGVGCSVVSKGGSFVFASVSRVACTLRIALGAFEQPSWSKLPVGFAVRGQLSHPENQGALCVSDISSCCETCRARLQDRQVDHTRARPAAGRTPRVSGGRQCPNRSSISKQPRRVEFLMSHHKPHASLHIACCMLSVQVRTRSRRLCRIPRLECEIRSLPSQRFRP